ncbi:MAG: hypothetical protein ACFFCO_03450 [Promethearchaeota archaeon]
MTTSDEQDKEFTQFLDIITYFCTELSSGLSPEYALIRSVQYFGEQSPTTLKDALKKIIGGTRSFASAWEEITESYQESRYKRILELLGRFISKGSKTGGVRMLKVIKHIRKNLTLARNRRNLIKAQRLKVLALSIVSAAVMGMIAGIAPILAITFSSSISFHLFSKPPISMTLQIAVTLFLTSIVSSYRLTQVVGSSSRTLTLCTLAFITTFVLTQNLLAVLY